MRITFSKTGPPLNHRLWTLIYLCCFLLGFCVQGFGEDTVKVNRPDRVTYQWQLLENYFRYLRMREMLYGKPKVEVKASSQHTSKTVPDAVQAPLDAEMPLSGTWRTHRQRAKQHPAFAGGTARSLSRPVRHEAAGGGYRAPVARPSAQKPLYEAPDRTMRLRGDVW